MAEPPRGGRASLLASCADVASGVQGKLFVETDSPCASSFQRRFPYLRGAVTDLIDREIVELFRWIRG